MILQQTTTDDQWVYLEDKEKRRYEDDKIKSMINKRKKLDMDISEDLRRRNDAIQTWSGKDKDDDELSDGMEIQTGLHDDHNVPLHKPILRNGPTTPGRAYASAGGIQFDWDNSIIDLHIKPSRNVNGVHKMKTPKPMKLSVDFGNKHSHVSNMGGFSIDLNCNPQNYRMDHKKIKNVNIGGVMSKMNNVADSHKSKIGSFGTSFNTKNVMKKTTHENKEEINDLSERLSGFLHSQKKQKKAKSSGVKLTAGNNLDFSVVGITSGLIGKKKKGVIL